MSTNPDLLVYCDGSAAPNPGPGGWGMAAYAPNGALGPWDRLQAAWTGGTGEERTTNNRMELTALIQGLRYVSSWTFEELSGLNVELRVDSKYVLAVLARTVRGQTWRKNDDLRVELAEALAAARATGANVRVQWVRGHVGEPGNTWADSLATRGRRDGHSVFWSVGGNVGDSNKSVYAR